MKYVCRYKDPEFVLEKLGFQSIARGYAKNLIDRKTRKNKQLDMNTCIIRRAKNEDYRVPAPLRLHCFVREKEIDLHLDEPHYEDKTKHISRKFCKTVRNEIKKMRGIDVSDRLIIRLIDRLKEIIGIT